MEDIGIMCVCVCVCALSPNENSKSWSLFRLTDIPVQSTAVHSIRFLLICIALVFFLVIKRTHNYNVLWIIILKEKKVRN